MIRPILDPKFRSAYVEFKAFQKAVEASAHHMLGLALERNQGYVYRFDLQIFDDESHDAENYFYTERLVKSLLWLKGGFRLYISGSPKIAEQLRKDYSNGGKRDFDFHFIHTLYDKDFEVVECTYEALPKEKGAPVSVGGHLEGKRIGFDAGGSDRKVSSVVNGETTYSEETVWFPKLESNPQYHLDGVYAAFKTAVEKLGGDVQAIGVSTAGCVIDNRVMVSSLFIKVSPEDHEKYTKDIYITCTKKLEEELGHPISLYVANDGDVTALAGALDLHKGALFGIAMGTSEAGGYIDANGNLTGWLNEPAFIPIDYNEDALMDEWSLDKGVGCKYFSQDAVIKLAPAAGIELDPKLSLAEKLKVVQKLNEEGHQGANQIFESIGVYLANALAYYSLFYDIKEVLILGRVTSGKGGDTILQVAEETLEKDFPEMKLHIGMPSEYMRRVGQSIAAASLPNA